MAVKRKSEVFYKYQLSKSHHDKVRPLMDYYLLQYMSGKMTLTEASKNVEYVVRYSYIFKDVKRIDLICWDIENYMNSNTPHP
jgi:hypothetical protein